MLPPVWRASDSGSIRPTSATDAAIRRYWTYSRTPDGSALVAKSSPIGRARILRSKAILTVSDMLRLRRSNPLGQCARQGAQPLRSQQRHEMIVGQQTPHGVGDEQQPAARQDRKSTRLNSSP